MDLRLSTWWIFFLKFLLLVRDFVSASGAPLLRHVVCHSGVVALLVRHWVFVCERERWGFCRNGIFFLFFMEKTCSFLFATGAPPMHGGCATVAPPLSHRCATVAPLKLIVFFILRFFFFFFCLEMLGLVRLGFLPREAGIATWCLLRMRLWRRHWR